MSDAIARLNLVLQGRYRVERELGSGGMATVYLAHDERHNRPVALKVLKPELAAVVGAERFLAEIETTANLQHPHILALYDSGNVDGLLFYVMPYVEGESLRDRLERNRQLPVDEAVGIAVTVAEALDFAHRRGVIHRDIKPANILLQDGKPVVADFGIALAVSSAGGHRLTETGLSLGTPHYMSPEQATGEVVGPQTDTWALGCVLYEMLAGEPPYTGSTPQAILGRIITGEAPSASAERRSVPPGVDAAVRRALEKLPADRFTSAAGFAKALQDPGFRHGVGMGAAPGASNRRTLVWGLVALTGIAAMAIALLVRPVAPPPMATSVTLPGGAALRSLGRGLLDVSPDGRTLVYSVRNADGEAQIHLRPLDRFEAIALPDVGSNAFFSHDGQWVAYAGGGAIRRAPVGGGPSVVVCADPECGFESGTWTTADTIVYSRDFDGLYKVAAAGGQAIPLTTLDQAAGEIDHMRPQALPGGRILYGVRFSTGDREIRLLSDGGVRTVHLGSSHARYVNGLLLYVVGSSLLAVDFDPDEESTDGESIEILDDLRLIWGGAAFAVSDDGTLVYVPEDPSAPGLDLVRVSRDGTPEVLSQGRRFERPRLSPTDSTVLVFGDRGALWTFDFASRIERRLTDGGLNYSPVWAPGDRILFGSVVDGRSNIFIKSADERNDTERFLTSEEVQWPDAVTPDGRTLLFSQRSRTMGGDTWTVPFPSGGEPTLLMGDESTTWPTGVSPDGRWLAYVTDRGGTGSEVYVTDFPDLVVHRRVSIDGGSESVWSPRLGELFYRNRDRMMVVAYRTDENGQFQPQPPRELFEEPYATCCTGLAEYAVAADGQSFFMLQGGEAREIRVWRGWERVAAAGQR